jgi:hypothetical protein
MIINVFIHYSFRKKMLSHYEYFLTDLSNSANILNYGKKANVIPIYKKGNNSWNQSSKFTLIPYAFNLCNKPRCHTLSNAFKKSQKTKQLISFLSSQFKIKLYISRSWLRIFFNRSLEQCKYPKLWKKSQCYTHL